MENKMLSFLNRYKFCALAGALLLLGLEISLSLFKDVILISGDMLDLGVSDMYTLKNDGFTVGDKDHFLDFLRIKGIKVK